MTEPAEQPSNRPWSLYCGIGLIALALLLAPFWYVWTKHAFYPPPDQVEETMGKPWKPFARLAMSSFITVFLLVLGALLIRIQFRKAR